MSEPTVPATGSSAGQAQPFWLLAVSSAGARSCAGTPFELSQCSSRRLLSSGRTAHEGSAARACAARHGQSNTSGVRRCFSHSFGCTRISTCRSDWAGLPPVELLYFYGAGSVAAHPLSDWEALSSSGPGEVLLAAADPSHVVGHPSAVLRNALLLAAARWRVPRLRVVAVRERGGRADVAASQLFDVALPAVPPGKLMVSRTSRCPMRACCC